MNKFKEKHFFKELIVPTAASFALFFGIVGLSAAEVSALDTQTVRLTKSGNEAEIILTFPEAAKEEIASLQISISVSASPSSANVEFVPDKGLAAKIAEGRYDSKSGTLNIYTAGTSPLFDKANPVLSLGRVRVTGSGSYADVKIIENSLKFVRGTELVVQDTGVEYSSDVIRISDYNGNIPSDTTDSGNNGNYGGGGFNVPEVTTAAVTTAETLPAESATSAAVTSVTTAPPATDTTEELPETGDNVPAIPVEGESFSAAATEKLSEAVSQAEMHKRADYTDDSYQILDEALRRAKALLADRESRQEQIDEALLILENAIGMLVPANSPSRADSVQDSEADHIVSEENREGETSPDVSLENSEETAPGESETKPATEGSTPDITTDGNVVTSDAALGENTADSIRNDSQEVESPAEEAGGLTVWIIVLVVLGAAVAVIAIAAVVSSNKKKASRKKSHIRTKSSKSRSRDDEDE